MMFFDTLAEKFAYNVIYEIKKNRSHRLIYN